MAVFRYELEDHFDEYDEGYFDSDAIDDDFLLSRYQCTAANIVESINTTDEFIGFNGVSFTYTMNFQSLDAHFTNPHGFDEFYKLLFEINGNLFLNLRKGNMIFDAEIGFDIFRVTLNLRFIF